MNRISQLEKEYVNEVLNNQFKTSKNNIYNNKLESAFSKRINMPYSISHVNGTATMHTALAALGVKEGDEVIVPPLTMSSTSLAVLQNNSIPIFADVDINTFNIDPQSIINLINKKTKAIITVALYGLSPEYNEILKICKEHNLFLIEDNAETFLSKYKGKYVGEFGDFSSFSFQASKHLTCGEGGMLSAKNVDFADNARRFSSLGYGSIDAKKGKISKSDIQDPEYKRHVSFGFNYRMSELCAAVSLAQLERSDELTNIRIKSAEYFLDSISESDLLIPQFTPSYSINTYWSLAVVLNVKNPKDWYRFRALFNKNKGDGYYAAWALTYFEPFFYNSVQAKKGIWQDFKTGLCPNAEYLQPRLIQLKTNYWNLEQAEEQAEILRKTIKQF